MDSDIAHIEAYIPGTARVFVGRSKTHRLLRRLSASEPGDCERGDVLDRAYELAGA